MTLYEGKVGKQYLVEDMETKWDTMQEIIKKYNS